MNIKTHLLIIDDDQVASQLLSDGLRHWGYRVSVAHDGVAGLLIAQRETPDLIILDVMMPGMDGYEVCRQLKANSDTRNILILMLTSIRIESHDKIEGLNLGADDYLAKPYDKEELAARLKALLRRSSVPPYSIPEGICIFSLTCKPEQHIDIRIKGTVSLHASSEELLHVKSDDSARGADQVPYHNWRFNSKHWGEVLYDAIFVKHPEVLSTFKQSMGTVSKESNLHLNFESPRDFLRVPLEFLVDVLGQGQNHLSLQHPLTRSIMNVRTNRTAISPEFLNDIWRKKETLKILLIGSNTAPFIPAVDDEIKVLGCELKGLFEAKRIPTQLKIIPTKKATYEVIRRELHNCKHHIVHYAGHGTHDHVSPENSHLFFWEKENMQGKVVPMSASELHMLLNSSDVRFVYLSCCWAAKTGEPSALLDDDFLGVADSVVQARVPSVLSFRWAVSDDGAKQLALSFYRSLAYHGQIDTALLDARYEVATKNRDDMTWLSPVLIMQGSP
jgi:DNA-binding response OmpR family regulator